MSENSSIKPKITSNKLVNNAAAGPKIGSSNDASALKGLKADEINERVKTGLVSKKLLFESSINSDDGYSDTEMSDKEFEEWLTLGNTFNSDEARSSSELQKLLMLTKLAKENESKLYEHMDVAFKLVKTNIDKLIGKNFNIGLMNEHLNGTPIDIDAETKIILYIKD